MSTPEGVKVDRLRPDEVDQATALLAHSFLDEPAFAPMFRGKGPNRTVRATTPWFRTFVRAFMPFGEIHAARIDGRLVGVGVRTPPGAYPSHGWKKRRYMLSLVASLVRMVATSRTARHMAGLGQELERLEPKEPFVQLAWVGVDPEFRRRGIGTALADEAVRLADAHRAPAWLVTFGPHVRALYERRGFVFERELHPFPGGPPCWTMRREARRLRG
jgi:GNAT superfamily N-acetyltransferase